MACCVTLPLSWIHEQPLWLEWFTEGRVHPELGLDMESLYLPDSWHESMAERFREARLACSVHLPFLGIDPADSDDAAALAARKHILRGTELAALYGAIHMIGHPWYRPRRPGRENDAIDGRWMAMSLALWPRIPSVGNAPLFFENTYETGPEALAALAVAAGGAKDSGSPAVGVCFDLGHWHAFAGCKREEELLPWLDAYAGLPLHLHLHDNDGTDDQHLGLGRGNVPFAALFALLASRGTDVTATLEPHDVEAFAASIAWLEKHDAIARRIGWQKPRMEAFPLGEIEKNLAK